MNFDFRFLVVFFDPLRKTTRDQDKLASRDTKVTGSSVRRLGYCCPRRSAGGCTPLEPPTNERRAQRRSRKTYLAYGGTLSGRGRRITSCTLRLVKTCSKPDDNAQCPQFVEWQFKRRGKALRVIWSSFAGIVDNTPNSGNGRSGFRKRCGSAAFSRREGGACGAKKSFAVCLQRSTACTATMESSREHHNSHHDRRHSLGNSVRSFLCAVCG